MKKYPILNSVRKRPRNTQAQCKCGEVGKFQTVIEVSYMRGEDEVLWSCEAHKKDLNFLLED